MANRRQDLETRLIAKDDASKVFDKVGDKAEQLEKGVEIPLTADDKASDDIRSLTQRLAGLSDEEKTIVLKAKVSDAERDVDRLLKSLRNVDQFSDEEVQIRIEALDLAKADLDRVQDELRQLDGDSATVHVDSTGVDDLIGKLDSIPGKFSGIGSSAQSAFASAGLTGGKLGAVAGAGAIAGAALSAADSYADMAIEAQELSNLTGATVEDTSRLAAVWQTTGADVNDLSDVLLQMDGVLKGQPELAARLGVSFDENTTSLDRFLAVTEAVKSGLIDMPTAGTIFGEEGVRQVNRLNTILGETKTVADALADVPAGAVVKDEDVDNALQLRDTMRDVHAEFNALASDIGSKLLPVLNKVDEAIQVVKEGAEFAWLGDVEGIPFLESLPGAVQTAIRYLNPVSGSISVATDATSKLNDEWDDWRGNVEGSVDPTLADARAKRELAAATEAAADKQAALNERYEDDLARAGLATSRLTAYNEVQAEIAENIIAAAEAGARFGQEAERIQDVLGSMDEAAVRVDAFATAWENAADTTAGASTNLADLVEANRALIDGFRDSEGKIRLARTELDVMSESGRDNIAAADALRDAYGRDLAQALEDAGGKYRVVRQRAAFWREELEGQLEALGLNKTQIDEYVEAVGLADKDVVTTIRLSGQEEALTKIEALNIQYDELPDEVETAVRQEILKGDYKGALAEIQRYYDDNPAILPVKPVIGRYVYPPGLVPTGSSTAPAGLSATAIAAGVTPMAGPTLAPVTVPIVAPAPKAPEIHLHATVNTAVAGDPFAIAQAVEQGLRRTARLMPTNQ